MNEHSSISLSVAARNMLDELYLGESLPLHGIAAHWDVLNELLGHGYAMLKDGRVILTEEGYFKCSADVAARGGRKEYQPKQYPSGTVGADLEGLKKSLHRLVQELEFLISDSDILIDHAAGNGEPGYHIASMEVLRTRLKLVLNALDLLENQVAGLFRPAAPSGGVDEIPF